MKVFVTLKAFDLIKGNEKILAEGPAILNDNTLLYKEPETNAKHKITFQDDIIIERKADVHSITRLEKNGQGSAIVESPYGVMTLEAECISLSKQNYCWLAEYRILSGNDVILHQRLEWRIHPFS